MSSGDSYKLYAGVFRLWAFGFVFIAGSPCAGSHMTDHMPAVCLWMALRSNKLSELALEENQHMEAQARACPVAAVRVIRRAQPVSR